MPLLYISIVNLGAFKEKTEFEFTTITILTGAYSVGKSKLLKTIK